MLNSRRFNQEIRRLDDGRIYFIQDHTMNIHSMYEYIVNVHPVAGVVSGSGPRSALRFTGPFSSIASSNTETATMTFTPPITIDFWFKIDSTYTQTYAPIILSETAGLGFPAARFCAFGPVRNASNSALVLEFLGIPFPPDTGVIKLNTWIHCQFLLPSGTTGVPTCRINGTPITITSAASVTLPAWTANAHRYIQIRTGGGIEFGNIRLSSGETPVAVENDPVPGPRTIVLLKGHVTPELTIPNRCSIAEDVEFVGMGATSKSHVWSGWYNIPRNIQTLTALRSDTTFDCRVVIGRPSEPASLNDMTIFSNTMIITSLTFQRFAGYFADDVNWFTGKTPTASGVVTNMTNLNTATNGVVALGAGLTIFSVQWTGFFTPNATGQWTFWTVSDDASYVWIDSTAVSGFTVQNAIVNNGGIHGDQEKNGVVNLVAGTSYPIRIQYGQNLSGYSFNFSFAGPDGVRRYNGIVSIQSSIHTYTNTYSSNVTLPINIIHAPATKFNAIQFDSSNISRSEMRSGCVPYTFRLEQNGRTLRLNTNTNEYDWDQGVRDGIFITSNVIPYNSPRPTAIGVAASGTVTLAQVNRPGSNVTCLCMQDALTLRTCAFNANGRLVLLTQPGKQTLANTMMHMTFSNIWNPGTNQSLAPILFRALQ